MKRDEMRQWLNAHREERLDKQDKGPLAGLDELHAEAAEKGLLLDDEEPAEFLIPARVVK